MKYIIRRYTVYYGDTIIGYYWRIAFNGKTIKWTKYWFEVLIWLSDK